MEKMIKYPKIVGRNENLTRKVVHFYYEGTPHSEM
jgi:hypothetical protein